MLKKIITLLCVLALGLPVAAQNQHKPQTKESVMRGLFNVVKSGGDWYFEIPDSIVGRRLLTTIRFTNAPAGTKKYGGEMLGEQTVYWETAPGDLLLLRSDLYVNVADSLDAIDRAVSISNSNPIIGTFKVESHKRGLRRIKVTSFFNEDNPAIGVNMFTKQAFGLQGYLPSASFIESIKSFPMNVEVRTTKTWMSAQPKTYSGVYTGKVTLGLNVSFVLLPEKPMQARLFDPRVGYFADRYNEFTDNQQRVDVRRFITRWRLEPKDSTDREKMKRGELVEPLKPIVYYIDPATPKKWRPYLIAGVNDWQKAFEQAGFKNAIIGKEWPENDSTMSMEDARYSVIRYLASDIENAYGPNVHDPRSGEIIESHICWYHNVMSLVHDWYMIQAGNIDEAARKMKFGDELMGELIRFVSSHEVGHTLGLRHNFGSSSTVPTDSLRSRCFTEKYGHTPSIMDYARFNYVAQPEDSITTAGIFPRIGDYDLWAIKWGYTPMFDAYDIDSDHWELEKLVQAAELDKNPRLWFGDGETNRTNDPRCQTEDLGDDAVKSSDYGIKNLQRMMPNLPEWTYQSNDINLSGLKGVYDNVVSQFMRYTFHVANNIGGVMMTYKTIDETGDIYADTPREKQERALDFINRHIFTEPTWLIDVPYIHRLSPDPSTITERFGTNVMNRLFSAASLERLTATYPLSDVLSDVERMLFSELRSGKAVTSYRQALQRSYIGALTTYFTTAAPTKAARADVLYALKNLRKRLTSNAGADRATRAHFASLADLIDRALVIK